MVDRNESLASSLSAVQKPSPTKGKSPIALALQRAKQLRSIASSSTKSALAKETEYYEKCAQNLSLKQDFDVFGFWTGKTNELIPMQLPTLSSIAPDILAIPASTAPLERAFSQIEKVIGSNRHRIGDDNMVKETFIRCNKQYLNYNF